MAEILDEFKCGNSDVELLKYMHQNAEMGKNTLTQISEIVAEQPFKDVVDKQLSEYENVYNQTSQKLAEMDCEPKSISGMAKISTQMMINLKTMMDKSPERVAEMIIQGGTMGIIDITKKLKEYKECSDDVKNIGFRLMWIEQKNTEEMKHFL